MIDLNKKIDTAIDYYEDRTREIMEEINSDKRISIDGVISYGKELESISHKISALEMAKNN